jgi:hypothetical protein
MGVPCKMQHLTLAKFIMGVLNKGGFELDKPFLPT